MGRRQTFTMILGVIVFCFSDAQAQLPIISLRSLSQSCFSPGNQYQVQVTSGNDTDEVTELRFSHPGIKATLKTGPPKPFSDEPVYQYGAFDVDVAEGVPLGQYHVVAVGRFGISNPRRVIVANAVSKIQTVSHDGDHPTAIQLGQSHATHLVQRESDVYKISLRRGQQIQIHLIGHGIDSRLVGSLSLLTPLGRIYQDSTGSLRDDARMELTVPHDGDWMIQVRDVLYRGGLEFPYLLKINVLKDQQSKLDPNLLNTIPLSSITTNETVRSMWDEGVDSIDEEPKTLKLPSRVVGEFPSTDGVLEHNYLCELKKSVPLVLEVVSQRLGEPTDCRILIERAIPNGAGATRWQRNAFADDIPNVSDGIARIQTTDPWLQWTPPEDGLYRIRISNADNGRLSRKRKRYIFSLRRADPDWHLLAYHCFPHKDPNAARPSGIRLISGGAETIRVFAVRRGQSLPIQVTAIDLPSGVHCAPARIAKNQSQTDLILWADENVPSATFPLRIQGELVTTDPTETRDARLAAMVWEKDAQVVMPRLTLVEELEVAVSADDIAPLSIVPTNGDVIETKKGSKITVPLKLLHRGKTKPQAVLRARNLPPGVRSGDLTIPANKEDANWTIDIGGNAQEGTYTFWGQAESRVRFSRNPQSLNRVKTYRDLLKRSRDDPNNSDQVPAIDKAIKDADAKIKTLTETSAPKDHTVYSPTQQITVKVIP